MTNDAPAQASVEAPSHFSAEAKAYWQARDERWRKVFAALRDYRMQNMCCEDEPSCGYPLVDLMSNEGQSIATGEEEMVCLADEIIAALSPPPTVGAEDEAVPYAHEFGRSNGDGTFSVVIERGEPKRANDQWPVLPLYIRPAPAADGQRVKVKALEWVHVPAGAATSERYEADGAGVIYSIYLRDSGRIQWCKSHTPPLETVRTIDEAKAAAQADFEQRIRASLATDKEG